MMLHANTLCLIARHNFHTAVRRTKKDAVWGVAQVGIMLAQALCLRAVVTWCLGLPTCTNSEAIGLVLLCRIALFNSHQSRLCQSVVNLKELVSIGLRLLAGRYRSCE